MLTPPHAGGIESDTELRPEDIPMTITATLLLAMLTTLLTFLLGVLVLEAFWAFRSRAVDRSVLLAPLPQPAPVPVPARSRLARRREKPVRGSTGTGF
jgi:hypothetical protein